MRGVALIAGILGAYVTTVGAQVTPAVTTLSSVSGDIQSIFAKHRDCVVKVLGTRDDSENAPLVYGTGFFIDAEGHVLTTATVASEATQLWVQSGEISYAATLVKQDPRTNLAVLQLKTVPKEVHFVALPSEQKIPVRRPGELCVAISSTKGMPVEPKLGMITGRDLVYGDNILGLGYFRSSLEICGGESGSPVFDSRGVFCGIMIAALPDIRASFVIPAEALKRVTDRLCAGLDVDYVSAGFCVQGQMSADGQKELVISSSECPNLKIGDKICTIDGAVILDESDIADILFFKSPGNHITITADRPETGSVTTECVLKPR